MATTLAIDCGGGGIKASVLDEAGTMRSRPLRVPTPYPLPPGAVRQDAGRSGRAACRAADRVTVGMPGMIRHGVVVATPHYVTRSGPRTKVDPELVAEWAGFDARTALAERSACRRWCSTTPRCTAPGWSPAPGCELVLTLGTGLGCALFDGGALAPHLEISQAPVRWGMTYDTYIGEHERRRLGDALWSRRVRKVVEGLRPVFLWDRLYLGGGNSRLITPAQLARMGDDVVVVPNTAGIVGGVRAWALRRP